MFFLFGRPSIVHTARVRIIVCLLLLLLGAICRAAPIVAASGGEGVTDDIFDASQLTMVLANSPLLACCGGAPAEDTFGGTGGVESFHTLFSDGPPVGSLDFINFRTANLIELTGYNALLADDSDNPANPGDPNRGSSSFSLFTSPDDTFTSLTLLSTTQLPNSYSSNFGTNAIQISDTFAPVRAQFFRLEITRTTSGGPRIRELDGIGRVVPEAGTAAFLVAGVGALLPGRSWSRRIFEASQAR